MKPPVPGLCADRLRQNTPGFPVKIYFQITYVAYEWHGWTATICMK